MSTPIYRDTEPGVSCAKIGNQTFDDHCLIIHSDE